MEYAKHNPPGPHLIEAVVPESLNGVKRKVLPAAEVAAEPAKAADQSPEKENRALIRAKKRRRSLS